MFNSSTTKQEILSQPDVWRESLEVLDAGRLRSAWGPTVTDVVITGCGSTHYLALTAAELLRRVPGLNVRAAPASELMAEASPTYRTPSSALLLAISRSGETSETVAAVAEFRRLGGGRVVAITTMADSTLANVADASVVVSAAAEVSVAQTRSFSSMLLAVQALCAALGGQDVGVLRDLPELATQTLEQSRDVVADVAGDQSLESFYFLGSGPLFGIASEAMLKLTEMSLTQSEAYHTLEFRHGPMSMCDPAAAVVALITPERLRIEQTVVNDITALGVRMLTLGKAQQIEVPTGLPAWARPVLYLLPLQLLALERCVAKGLNPDQPRHLTAVIHLDPVTKTA